MLLISVGAVLTLLDLVFVVSALVLSGRISRAEERDA